MDLNDTIKRFQTGKMIRTVKTLHFIEDGKVIKGVRWRTMKTQELFAYLIHHKSATNSELIKLLWPNCDITKATNNLYTTIYQLKKMLESIHFDIDIISTNGRYELNLNEVAIDIDIFDNVLENFDSVTSENYQAYLKLMKYYDNDYLKNHHFNWKTNKYRYHKMLYITMLYKLIDYLEGADEYFEALFLALTIESRYPSFQNIHLTLMQLYHKIGDYYSVQQQYQRLIDTTENPSDYITEWYLEWEKLHLVQPKHVDVFGNLI